MHTDGAARRPCHHGLVGRAYSRAVQCIARCGMNAACAGTVWSLAFPLLGVWGWKFSEHQTPNFKHQTPNGIRASMSAAPDTCDAARQSLAPPRHSPLQMLESRFASQDGSRPAAWEGGVTPR